MSNFVAGSTAWNEEAARNWIGVERDRSESQISYPWKLAAAVSSLDVPVASVLDVGSGPGGFLAAVLDEAPNATGVWFDFSETMREEATSNLERFAGRVEFRIGDMTEVDTAGDPESFDLITTSRATHHLLVGDLAKFYASSYGCLRSSGWIANIDILNPGEPWNERLRRVRSKLNGPRERATSGHLHPNPFPSLDDHLAALRVAGFSEPQVVWSSLVTGLLMAQKP